MFLDAVRRLTEEWVGMSHDVNPMSISVMTHFATLVVALSLSFLVDGRAALSKVLDVHYMWRWAVVAGLIIASFYLQAEGVAIGLPGSWVQMLSYANVPIALAIGGFVFKRSYGKLEVLAVCMLTCGISALIVLRVRCMDRTCDQLHELWEDKHNLGAALILASIIVYITAWTLTERILKDRSPGIIRAHGGRHSEVILIMLVHLAFCQSVINGGIWAYHGIDRSGSILGGSYRRPDLFGEWQFRHYFLVVVYVLHLFLSCHVIKHFSTVSWVLSTVVSAVIVVCISDPALHRYEFGQRALPSLLIAPTIVLSAIIFQTGRLNLVSVRRRLGIPPSSSATFTWSELFPCASRCSRDEGQKQRAVRKPIAASSSDESLPAESPSRLREFARLIARYSAVIVYILSQAFRENLSQKAQSSRIIVPQSLNVAAALGCLALALSTTFWTYKWEGLRAAFNLRKVFKFAFPALLFALSSFFGSMAFALGASAAAKDAAGRIYTPAAALLSRWILGKFYMWLEWLALVILTLSCMAFGLLDVSGAHGASLAGLICAVCSGLTSAVNSLVMERLMKGETEPYVVQNVRLSIGSAIFNVLFLFAMGVIGDAESPARPDLGFWNYRPITAGCTELGACSNDGVFMTEDGFSVEQCLCVRGVFVGWGSDWTVYAALAAAVIYSWVTGLVVKQFSSVYRSVADGIMLLIVFFVLTPMFDSAPFPLTDMAKTLVVLMVPLSGTTFSYAAWEMQQAMAVAATKNDPSPRSTMGLDAELDIDMGMDTSADSDSVAETA